MANPCIVNLNPDLVGFWRSNLNILDREFLSGLPGDSSLAGDGLFLVIAVSALRFTLGSIRVDDDLMLWGAKRSCAGTSVMDVHQLTFPTVSDMVTLSPCASICMRSVVASKLNQGALDGRMSKAFKEGIIPPTW